MGTKHFTVTRDIRNSRGRRVAVEARCTACDWQAIRQLDNEADIATLATRHEDSTASADEVARQIADEDE